MSLSATIKSIQDIMRKDVGVDGDAQRIGQLGWLLFFKIFSDQDAELELNDDDYESPLPHHPARENICKASLETSTVTGLCKCCLRVRTGRFLRKF